MTVFDVDHTSRFIVCPGHCPRQQCLVLVLYSKVDILTVSGN